MKCLLTLAALGAAAAWRQSTVGSISGQVIDASGAAVPNWVVTATNVRTGLKQAVMTQRREAHRDVRGSHGRRTTRVLEFGLKLLF